MIKYEIFFSGKRRIFQYLIGFCGLSLFFLSLSVYIPFFHMIVAFFYRSRCVLLSFDESSNCLKTQMIAPMKSNWQQRSYYLNKKNFFFSYSNRSFHYSMIFVVDFWFGIPWIKMTTLHWNQLYARVYVCVCFFSIFHLNMLWNYENGQNRKIQLRHVCIYKNSFM